MCSACVGLFGRVSASSAASKSVVLVAGLCEQILSPSSPTMLYYVHMQPNTQQPNVGQQQGFYRPSQPSSPFQMGVDDEGAAVQAQSYDKNDSITWEASEYIHRSKDLIWVLGFGAIVLVGVGVSIWLQAWTFTALVVAMAIAMGVFAFRPPKVKHYTLTHQGLNVDGKMYNLTDFRAFGVLAEEAFYSALLIPVKRFMPAVTMYFAQEDGEKIVDILGSHLPLEDIQADPIDVLMRRLHF
jgi:hypothetical protein